MQWKFLSCLNILSRTNQIFRPRYTYINLHSYTLPYRFQVTGIFTSARATVFGSIPGTRLGKSGRLGERIHPWTYPEPWRVACGRHADTHRLRLDAPRTSRVCTCSRAGRGRVGACDGAEGRRVSCSIGHYLRRVTGSVVTAPRFAHCLSVFQRSPTLSLSFSHARARAHLSSISVPSLFALSLSIKLVLFVYSPFLCPSDSTVSPLRNLPHDSRSGHRRLDLGLEARRCAAWKTSAFFPGFAAGEASFHGYSLACFSPTMRTHSHRYFRSRWIEVRWITSSRCYSKSLFLTVGRSCSYRIINSLVNDEYETIDWIGSKLFLPNRVNFASGIFYEVDFERRSACSSVWHLLLLHLDHFDQFWETLSEILTA